MSKWDELIKRIGQATTATDLPVTRRVIGNLADNYDVYYPFSTVRGPNDMYLAKETLERRKDFVPPPAGSESGMLNPYNLILEAVYPEDLRKAAVRRLGTGMQGPYSPQHIPLLARPSGRVTGDGAVGAFRSRVDPSIWQRTFQHIDISDQSADALRTLIHEARHATEPAQKIKARPWTSVSSPRAFVEGYQLSDRARRYYANPSEILAYLGEAGDDFVRDRGRLVENIRDANAVMERIEAKESLAGMSPLSRKMYVDAYKSSPTARQKINDLLTRYFAVPVAAGAAAASQDQ